jgi:hypothetical protein
MLEAGMGHEGRLFQMKICILKLFLLTGQGQYARSLICDLLIQSHQRDTKHAVWNLSRTDPNCFNEEAGEISLSVLARLTAGTDKRDLDMMRQRYRLVKSTLVVAHHTQAVGRERVVPKRTTKYEIDVNGAEVRATADHFNEVIRKCEVNQYQCIQPPKVTTVVKNAQAYTSHLVTASHLPKRRWWSVGHESETGTSFDKQVRHIKQKWFNIEYCKFSRPWFEPTFVDKVRRFKVAGQEWLHLFNVVPNALTDDEGDIDEDDADDADDADVGSRSGGDERLEDGSSDSGVPAGGNELIVHDELSNLRPGRSPSDEPSAESEDAVVQTEAVQEINRQNRLSVSKKRRRSSRNRDSSANFSSDSDGDGDDEAPRNPRRDARRKKMITSVNARNKLRRRKEAPGFYRLINQHGTQDSQKW